MAKFCVDPRRWDLEAEAIWQEVCGDQISDMAIDIGCGFGYFVNVSKWHSCQDEPKIDIIGLDLPEPIIIEATSILQVPFAAHDIRQTAHNGIRSLLPAICDGEGEYDLVTMFGVNLRDDEGAYWTACDYADFTKDVCRWLSAGGRFVMRPNLPYTWSIGRWELLISDFATVERTKTTITVRPK
jgi:hypothetical protein